MSEDLDAANRYMERAEECQVISSGMTDLTAKRSLMQVADGYLKMAKCRVIMHDTHMALDRSGRDECNLYALKGQQQKC